MWLLVFRGVEALIEPLTCMDFYLLMKYIVHTVGDALRVKCTLQSKVYPLARAKLFFPFREQSFTSGNSVTIKNMYYLLYWDVLEVCVWWFFLPLNISRIKSTLLAQLTDWAVFISWFKLIAEKSVSVFIMACVHIETSLFFNCTMSCSLDILVRSFQ